MKLLFTAVWCTTCKALKSMLDVTTMGVQNIDVDTPEGAKLAEEYKVDIMPCMINGDNRLDGLGSNTKEQIEEFYK